MKRAEVLGREQSEGRHGGLRLALAGPAEVEVHPEPVVPHQHQEGLVQRPGA